MKTDLSDEEKRLIADALSNNIEPPSGLMTKLFPGLAEKFDVVKLDRAKIMTLEYAGKRSEAAILNQASLTDAGSPLQVERCFKGGSLTGETQLDLFERAQDRTVFAKDISTDGMIKMTGLTESIAVIAIDKHGNESKAVIV